MADPTILLAANARIAIAEAMIAAYNTQDVDTFDMDGRGAVDIVFEGCDR